MNRVTCRESGHRTGKSTAVRTSCVAGGGSAQDRRRWSGVSRRFANAAGWKRDSPDRLRRCAYRERREHYRRIPSGVKKKGVSTTTGVAPFFRTRDFFGRELDARSSMTPGDPTGSPLPFLVESLRFPSLAAANRPKASAVRGLSHLADGRLLRAISGRGRGHEGDAICRPPSRPPWTPRSCRLPSVRPGRPDSSRGISRRGR